MASLNGKLNVEVEIRSSASRFWEGITNSNELFPKIFPEQYKSIELLQGELKGVGSIRKINFGEGVPIIATLTERIDSFDEANKTLSYSTIDGDLLGMYKTFDATLELAPNGDGCTVKWVLAYEKTGDDVPEPRITLEMAKKTFEDLDAYLDLIKNSRRSRSHQELA